MILDVQNISKAFNEKQILDSVSFHIEDNDKVALIGINGAGKTTLLRIITGEYEPDEGIISLSRDKNIGYLSQEATVDSNNTIYEELLDARKDLVLIEEKLRSMEDKMSSLTGRELDDLMNSYTSLSHSFEISGGFSYKSEINGLLKGLGFDSSDIDRSINTLSGGQKTRVALSKLLVTKPDLIILDEPTNHLDINAISFLENYLLNYNKAVLIVSHDRYFLDKMTNKVVEIENTKATTFLGNYSDYAVKKEALRNEQLSLYYKQQAQILHQEKVIEKLKQFNREKSIKRAESREKALSKINRIEKPVELNDAMNISLLPERISGNDVLDINKLTMGFNNNILFKDIDFSIKRGEHVALIGDNGTGKTTILKIINNLINPISGEIKIGTNVDIGYYDQEHQVLHEDKTLFDELQDEYPTMNNTDVRNTLAAFLFTNDDVFKLIKNLSGGEKGRVSLAKLMLSKSNLLILDEPTNHLDITSKEILEDALNSYEGTVLYVSHDRYFINRTASRVIELANSKITTYLGNYDYYLEKKYENIDNDSIASSTLKVVNNVPSSKNSDISTGALDYKAQKELQAKQRKKENELKKCEERIDVLEKKIKELEEKLQDPAIATSSVKLQEVTKEIEVNQNELNDLYEKWEELS
ncbi:MAG: ABC-F family ATP-binding cassette domain-containing protein [Lachnospiraceae bacterium]|nr:ABC-F family ATP-binding cassette domain-containing protein [Lachnospiraceae bacterium]